MSYNPTITAIVAGHEAAHRADGSSLTQLGHAREEIWFRQQDAELIARLKSREAAMGGNTPSSKPAFAEENSELFNRRVQHEASRHASTRGPWFTEPLAHSREDAWFRQRDRELVEQMRSRCS